MTKYITFVCKECNTYHILPAKYSDGVCCKRCGGKLLLPISYTNENGASSNRIEVLKLIDKERNRQDAKWGEQNHNPAKWVGILGVEFGEYCQVVNETIFDNGPAERAKGGTENMIRELTHVAAVAVGAIECLLRNADKPSCEMCRTEPQYREVRRPAEVGEWIKIIEATKTSGEYDNGSIGFVTQVAGGNVVLVTINGYKNSPIYHSEYVVLEGYQPCLS